MRRKHKAGEDDKNAPPPNSVTSRKSDFLLTYLLKKSIALPSGSADSAQRFGMAALIFLHVSCVSQILYFAYGWSLASASVVSAIGPLSSHLQSEVFLQ